VTRQPNTPTPRTEKYSIKAGRRKSPRRSSRERVGSGTIPNTAMRVAPPAIRIVPNIIHSENMSPSMMRAKKAFQRRDTAPNGARMTTGSDAICTSDPSTLEEMNIAKPNNQSLGDKTVSRNLKT
jgi:hypothetical protein